MNNKQLIERLKTVTPALFTPLTKERKLDEAALRKLVKFVLGKGATTLFVLGYAGECLALNAAERKRVVEIAREEAGSDIVLIAGVMDDSTDLILEHIADAKSAGADIVLSTPTNFFPLTDNELYALYKKLNDESPLPIILYNCPDELNSPLNPKLIKKLAVLPNIIGLKQTSHIEDVENIVRVLRDVDEFIMLSGSEFVYFPALALGIKGFVMGGPGNFCIDWCLDIFNKFMSGKYAEAQKCYYEMNDFLDELYWQFDYPSLIPQGKAAMEVFNIMGRWMKHPVESCCDTDVERIRAIMAKYKLI